MTKMINITHVFFITHTHTDKQYSFDSNSIDSIFYPFILSWNKIENKTKREKNQNVWNNSFIEKNTLHIH